MIRMTTVAAAMTAAMALGAGPAQAGPATDALARCLVAKSTETDKTDLMVWAFASISLHPSVRPYTNVSDAQRDALSRKAGAVFQRLVIVDCRQETVAALRQDGEEAMGSAFETLGGAAVGGMMTDPGVERALSGIADHLSEAQFEALFDEAGR